MRTLPGGRVALDLTGEGPGAGRPALSLTAAPERVSRLRLPGASELAGLGGRAAKAMGVEVPPEVAAVGAKAAQAMGVEIPPEIAALAQPAGEEAGAEAGAPAAAPAAAPAPAPALSPAASGAPPSIDDIYDGVIDRLRRDLLAERERMGDLLGNIGH
jgi:hypothetical protein